MKRLLVGLSLAAVTAGCSDQNAILLLNARLLDGTCETQDVYVAAGAMDLGLTTAYWAAFEIQSEMFDEPVTVNDSIVTPGSRNDFIARRAVFRYYTAIGGTLTEITSVPIQNVPISFVVPAGATRSGTYLLMNMVTPAAASAFGALTPPTTVVVRFFLEGETVAGSPLRTNEVEFPITIHTSCSSPDPDAPFPIGYDPPCGNAGQDVSC